MIPGPVPAPAADSGIAPGVPRPTLVAMKSLRFLFLLGAALVFAPALMPQSRADDGSVTLQDVHEILLQAAGTPDNPTTPDQQKDLLGKARDMMRHLPHVYHGQLKHAQEDVEAALNELSTGDPAHKVREDIFDADDLIKSIM